MSDNTDESINRKVCYYGQDESGLVLAEVQDSEVWIGMHSGGVYRNQFQSV